MMLSFGAVIVVLLDLILPQYVAGWWRCWVLVLW